MTGHKQSSVNTEQNSKKTFFKITR